MPTSCHRRRRQLPISFPTVAIFLLLAPISVLARANPSLHFSNNEKVINYQKAHQNHVPRTHACHERTIREKVPSRRRLGGPGSWPPSCRSKCGRCLPCKPVHVPIHPGVGMPLEYYPEAWRCKCGSKLFMP